MSLPQANNPLAEIRVLVVDDNRDAAESLCQLIEFMGCRTALAFDGHSGLTVFRSFNPQLAFIDLDMPGMDGCEVVRQLRQEGTTPRPMFICLTGRKEAETQARCLRAGFDRFLTKPIDVNTLMEALDGARKSVTP